MLERKVEDVKGSRGFLLSSMQSTPRTQCTLIVDYNIKKKIKLLTGGAGETLREKNSRASPNPTLTGNRSGLSGTGAARDGRPIRMAKLQPASKLPGVFPRRSVLLKKPVSLLLEGADF